MAPLSIPCTDHRASDCISMLKGGDSLGSLREELVSGAVVVGVVGVIAVS